MPSHCPAHQAQMQPHPAPDSHAALIGTAAVLYWLVGRGRSTLPPSSPFPARLAGDGAPASACKRKLPRSGARSCNGRQGEAPPGESVEMREKGRSDSMIVIAGSRTLPTAIEPLCLSPCAIRQAVLHPVLRCWPCWARPRWRNAKATTGFVGAHSIERLLADVVEKREAQDREEWNVVTHSPVGPQWSRSSSAS